MFYYDHQEITDRKRYEFDLYDQNGKKYKESPLEILQTNDDVQTFLRDEGFKTQPEAENFFNVPKGLYPLT